MRIRSGIPEVDALGDALYEPTPPVVQTVDDIPSNAEAACISRASRGLEKLATRSQLKSLVGRSLGDAELDWVGRMESLEQLRLNGLRARDLSALASLRRLRILSISVSARLESLAGIEEMTELALLSTWSTTRLRSIDAVSRLSGLRVFALGGGMYRPIRIPTLAPLAGCEGLLSLTLSSVRVADRSLRPIAQLRSLRRLQLPLLFPASEFHMLEQALPDAQGQWRDLWRQYVRGASR